MLKYNMLSFVKNWSKILILSEPLRKIYFKPGNKNKYSISFDMLLDTISSNYKFQKLYIQSVCAACTNISSEIFIDRDLIKFLKYYSIHNDNCN